MSRSGRLATLTDSASSSHRSLKVTKRRTTPAATTKTTAATIHGVVDPRRAVAAPSPGLAARAGASEATFIARTLTEGIASQLSGGACPRWTQPDRVRHRVRPCRTGERRRPGRSMASVSTASGHEDSSRGYRIEILLISFAGLLLEIAYTRVISFKLFYYYTYLVIGLALLGIGTGGVLVAISRRMRRASTDAILMWSLLLGAASVGVGYLIVAVTRTDSLTLWDYGTFDSVSSLVRLVLICLVLFASFIAIGVVLATLFGRRSDEIGRLYFADLLGAGLACAVV